MTLIVQNRVPLRAGIASVSATIADATAPTVPTGLQATAASASQINLSWNASNDNLGVMQSGVSVYRIRRNGVFLVDVNSPALTYSNTGLPPSTPYSYTVAARDVAGNESAQSAAANATTNAATGWLPFTGPTFILGTASNWSFDPYDPSSASAFQWASGSAAPPTGVSLDSPGKRLVYNGGGSVGVTNNLILEDIQDATADWLARAAAATIAAYDFGTPANGGDWKWGSLRPGITVRSYREEEPPRDTWRNVDTSIAPPGSSQSLRWTLPQGSGERSDNWMISIDNYADQIGENDEVWIQWRQRMNSTYASFGFLQEGGGYTTWKSLMVSEGMQNPHPYTPPRAYYGYQGPGTQGNNTLNDVRFCSENQIVMIARHAGGQPQYKWPRMYHGCSFYANFTDFTGAKYTDMNEGLPSPVSCLYSGGTGNADDPQSCFLYVPDQWHTMMVRIITGPQGTATSSIGGGSQNGFINSTVEYYGGYQGQAVRLLHRKSGIVIRRGNGSPSPGWSPDQKLGVFSWTTFMTLKDDAQSHPDAETWISQIIISRNRPTDPV